MRYIKEHAALFVILWLAMTAVSMCMLFQGPALAGIGAISTVVLLLVFFLGTFAI